MIDSTALCQEALGGLHYCLSFGSAVKKKEAVVGGGKNGEKKRK